MIVIPIGKLAETMGATIDETVRAIKIKLFNGIIRDTRVDTGRLRGNWQTTTAKPADEEIDRLDPSGGQAMNDVQATVKGDTIDFITNNLSYSEIWEERDGMIAKNVQRLQRIVKEVTA